MSFRIAAFAALMCLGLGACNGSLPVDIPTPSNAANSTTADERAGLAVETAYSATAEFATLAFRSGLIAPTQSAEARAPDFCGRVLAGRVNAAALDRGGRILAADCRAYRAVLVARAAYDAGNASDYRTAAAEAQRAVVDFLALVKGN